MRCFTIFTFHLHVFFLDVSCHPKEVVDHVPCLPVDGDMVVQLLVVRDCVNRKTNAAFRVEPSSEYKLLCWKQNYDCCCLLLPTHKTFRTLLQNYKALPNFYVQLFNSEVYFLNC